MVKQFLPAVVLFVLLASCSSIKPLNFTSNKQVASANTTSQETSPRKNTQPRFIEEIAVTPESTQTETTEEKKEIAPSRPLTVEQTAPAPSPFDNRSAGVENASALQLKYSILLNTEVEQIQNKVLFESVDEWYGTRYRMGGMTKTGVDCSAFVQAVFAAAYGLSLPRTAREQYKASQRISRAELKEGDLLFFNTRGGVSHVGIYLQNNKFVHASASKGVTVSDMFDPYYLKRFIGAGRLGEVQESLSSSN